MLEYTAERANALGVTNLETHHAGFLTYEHADAPLDWIVTKFALHHLPDAWKGVAVAKMYSLLAPGGRLFLEDVVFSFPPSQHVVHLQHWIESKPGRFSKEQYESHVRDEYSTFGFIMEVILQDAGFEIHEANYRDPVYAEYLCVKDAEHQGARPQG
jgi:SAM-dependent methyltransferase